MKGFIFIIILGFLAVGCSDNGPEPKPSHITFNDFSNPLIEDGSSIVNLDDLVIFESSPMQSVSLASTHPSLDADLVVELPIRVAFCS